MTSKVIDKFLKYISIDTTSDSSKEETPSTPSQRDLADLLVKELKELGIEEIHYDKDRCYVYAKLKGNKNSPCPRTGQ